MHMHLSRLTAPSQGRELPVAPFVPSLRCRARLRSTPVRVAHSHALTPRTQHRCSLVSVPPPSLHQQRSLSLPPARKARCAAPRLVRPTHQPGRAGPLARSLLCQRRQLAFRPHPASAHCPIPPSLSSAHSTHTHTAHPPRCAHRLLHAPRPAVDFTASRRRAATAQCPSCARTQPPPPHFHLTPPLTLDTAASVWRRPCVHAVMS
jgi:hypothetical protein